MSRISKFIVVCALALAALVASTTAASAANGISIGARLTVTARGPTTLIVAGNNIICTVDLTLDINATILKSVGAAVGSARNGTITNCNGGYSGTIDNTIPISYTGWSGALPSGIRVATGVATGALFTMTGGTVFGANRCQFRGSPAVTLSGPGTSFTGGSFSGPVTYNAGPAGCPRSASIGNAALTLYGALTSVTITLI